MAILTGAFMATFFLLPLAILEVLKWQTRLWWSFGYPWAVMGFVFWLINKIVHVPLMLPVCFIEQGMDKWSNDTSKDRRIFYNGKKVTGHAPK